MARCFVRTKISCKQNGLDEWGREGNEGFYFCSSFNKFKPASRIQKKSKKKNHISMTQFVTACTLPWNIKKKMKHSFAVLIKTKHSETKDSSCNHNQWFKMPVHKRNDNRARCWLQTMKTEGQEEAAATAAAATNKHSIAFKQQKWEFSLFSVTLYYWWLTLSVSPSVSVWKHHKVIILVVHCSGLYVCQW